MKKRTFFMPTLLLMSSLFLPPAFAQDFSQWELPDGAVARLGKGHITAVSYSPDGTRFAAATPIGIWLYDAQTYEETALLSGHTWELSALAFSPDGGTLASASWDDPVRLWDVHTGKLRAALPGYVNYVSSIVFSPDGKTLAIANAYEILLWDAETGKQRTILEGHTGSVEAIAFTPDSGSLVSASRDKTLRKWDVRTGQLHATLEVDIGRTTVFSPDGKRLVSVDRDRQCIQLWETDTGQLRHTLIARTHFVAFSPDGRTLASGGGWPDYPIQLWDAATGEKFANFTGHISLVNALAFSPDGKTLLGGSGDGTLRMWNMETGENHTTLQGHASWISAVAFSPDGRTLANGSSPHAIQLWDVHTRQYRATLEADAFPIWSVVFSPDGRMLVSGSSEEVLVWSVHTEELRERYQTWYGAVAFSPDGETLASGRFDGTIRLWNARTIQNREAAQSRVVPDTHRISPTSSVFSPNGKTLAGAGREGYIWLWDAHTTQLQIRLVGHRAHVYTLAFSPDGKTLASGSSDETIRLWNMGNGSLREILRGHTGGVTSVAFSPDGSTLASGSNDGTIRLWDARTGRDGTTFTGHKYEVNTVSFSPDGSMLASGGGEGTILLWKVPAPSAALLRITPVTLESPAVGEQLHINIEIVGGQNLVGYQLTVQFDETALRFISRTHNDYLPSEAFVVPPIVKENRVSLVATSLQENRTSESSLQAKISTEAGTLVSLTFEVVARKASTLNLTEAILSDSEGKRSTVYVKKGWIVEPPWDVNFDGVVNVQDLAIVASRLGNTQSAADVNDDGIVDIADLVLVASGLDIAAGAPSIIAQYQVALTDPIFSATAIRQWIRLAEQCDISEKTSPSFQKGLVVLERFLAFLTKRDNVPTETALFANYPNPFNPETWIPYQLTEAASVTLIIYTANGRIVRTLEFGHQPAGIYQDRSRAAYWDGKNELGEPVASGVYFYTLMTGPQASRKVVATRKMLIRK